MNALLERMIMSTGWYTAAVLFLSVDAFGVGILIGVVWTLFF
jgi:hypothetical protein